MGVNFRGLQILIRVFLTITVIMLGGCAKHQVKMEYEMSSDVIYPPAFRESKGLNYEALGLDKHGYRLSLFEETQFNEYAYQNEVTFERYNDPFKPGDLFFTVLLSPLMLPVGILMDTFTLFSECHRGCYTGGLFIMFVNSFGSFGDWKEIKRDAGDLTPTGEYEIEKTPLGNKYVSVHTTDDTFSIKTSSQGTLNIPINYTPSTIELADLGGTLGVSIDAGISPNTLAKLRKENGNGATKQAPLINEQRMVNNERQTGRYISSAGYMYVGTFRGSDLDIGAGGVVVSPDGTHYVYWPSKSYEQQRFVYKNGKLQYAESGRFSNLDVKPVVNEHIYSGTYDTIPGEPEKSALAYQSIQADYRYNSSTGFKEAIMEDGRDVTNTAISDRFEKQWKKDSAKDQKAHNKKLDRLDQDNNRSKSSLQSKLDKLERSDNLAFAREFTSGIPDDCMRYIYRSGKTRLILWAGPDTAKQRATIAEFELRGSVCESLWNLGVEVDSGLSIEDAIKQILTSKKLKKKDRHRFKDALSTLNKIDAALQQEKNNEAKLVRDKRAEKKRFEQKQRELKRKQKAENQKRYERQREIREIETKKIAQKMAERIKNCRSDRPVKPFSEWKSYPETLCIF